MARTIQEFLRSHSINTLPHPGYSPDLNLCDYWFFNHVKKVMRGVQHDTMQELGRAVDAAIQRIDQQEFTAVWAELCPGCRNVCTHVESTIL